MQNNIANGLGSGACSSIRSMVLFFAALFLAVSNPTFALDVLLGSSQTGTFNHHTGRILCRLVNSPSEDINCDVSVPERDIHSTDQIHIITNVRNGALDLGIIDSAVQYDAVNRTGQFEYFDMNFDNLRSLFSLNGVPFTVVARQEHQINTLSDLKGKKINVGNPGSEQRTIMDNLIQAGDLSKKDFLLVEELPAAQSQDTLALCFGTVDAVVRFDIHPNAATKHMVDLCDANLVEVSGSVVDALIDANPFYVTLSVPGGIYASNAGPVPTFGLVQTVIATEDLDDETAYTLVKLVFEQLDRLKSSHAAFRELNPDSMHDQGLSLPLHPGAERYYREQGWMQ